MFFEIVTREDVRLWLNAAHIVEIVQDAAQAGSGIIEIVMSNGARHLTNDFDPALHGVINQ